MGRNSLLNHFTHLTTLSIYLLDKIKKNGFARFDGSTATLNLVCHFNILTLLVLNKVGLEATNPARSCASWTRSPSPNTSRRPQKRSSSKRRWRKCLTRPFCSLWRCRNSKECWLSTSPLHPLTGYGT